VQKVLPNIIEHDQTGYVKGRFIGTNIRTVEDVICHSDKYLTNGFLMFCDFQKAFDSLEWEFMFQTLKKF
jgi:hypothetical protein